MALPMALRSVGFLDVSQRIRLRDSRGGPEPFSQNHLFCLATKTSEKSGLDGRDAEDGSRTDKNQANGDSVVHRKRTVTTCSRNKRVSSTLFW